MATPSACCFIDYSFFWGGGWHKASFFFGGGAIAKDCNQWIGLTVGGGGSSFSTSLILARRMFADDLPRFLFAKLHILSCRGSATVADESLCWMNCLMAGV